MLTLNCNCYRFDQGYAELWYTIPTADIFSIDELDKSKNTISKKYSYRLIVSSQTGNDSATHTGIKSAEVNAEQHDDQIMDYIPIYLNSGSFIYQLEIVASGDKVTKSGEIDVPSDTVLFFSSDLIASKKTRVISSFARQGVELIPLITPEFVPSETLFTYLEVYGMVPDSLFYTIRYVIVDTASNIVFSKDLRQLKYDYRQVDTLNIALTNFSQGRYQVHVAIYDPALNKMVALECGIKVKETGIDIEGMPYAYDIEIFLSTDEYRTFLGLDFAGKRAYLKKFWSKTDYLQFEKRLLEADEKFSTSNLKGHKTNLGKYFILNGPPDEIEYRPMETVGKPSQVWYYHAQGLSILFVDNDGDGNYEMMGNLDFEKDFTRDIPINWIKN